MDDVRQDSAQLAGVLSDSLYKPMCLTRGCCGTHRRRSALFRVRAVPYRNMLWNGHRMGIGTSGALRALILQRIYSVDPMESFRWSMLPC